MTIFIEPTYAAALAAASNGDYPRVGYHNLVTVDTLQVDEEDADFPTSNLGNPATNLLWKSGSTVDQYLTVLFGLTVNTDYLALVRHNFGSGAVVLTVEGLPPGGNPATPGDWDVLAGPETPDDDTALMFWFAPTDLIGIRLKLEPVAIEPQAAVLYTGKLLAFERGVQAGHTPITYARQRTILSPRSQSGEFLGRVISGGSLVSSVSIIKLSAAWYRSTLDPFFAVAAEQPFFWAWRPLSYPDELGFVWLANQPVPNPSDLAGHIDIGMQLEGLL